MLRLHFVFALIVIAATARASVLEDLENVLEARNQEKVDDFVARVIERMQKGEQGNTVFYLFYYYFAGNRADKRSTVMTLCFRTLTNNYFGEK